MANRLTKYDAAITPTLCGHLAARGLTEDEISALIGVSRRTLVTWKDRYPEFRQALQSSKDFVDALVEGSLLKCALGYDVEELTRERIASGKTRADGTPRMRFAVTKRVRKTIGPDKIACIHWLNNRKPKQWRSRNHVVFEDERPFESMSDEELRQIVAGSISDASSN